MRKVGKLFAVTFALAATFAAPAAFAETDEVFVRLQIGGRTLAWPQPLRGALKLTWSLVDSATSTAEARNCGQMVAATSKGMERAGLLRETAGAFTYWQSIAAVDFEFTEDPSKADVLIGAQETPQGIAFADVIHRPAGNMLQGEITRGLICLNTSARWKTGFDGDLKSYDLRYVLAHEIGHVLGLDHPSASGQLMSWRYDERTRDLQRGDIRGMVSLYGPRLRVDAERK